MELGARPRVGVIGAGRVGLALGVAIDRAGWPVVAVSSRDPGRGARFRALVAGAVSVADARDLTALVDVVLVTVPDDVIGPLAASLRLRDGQGLVHTSGALSASVLRPSGARGTAGDPATTVASLHPLLPFADLERALGALPGATIAIEGDEPLVTLLAELVHDLGARALVVSAEGKAAYHAAAVLAAGGFVALLDSIAELARGAGLDEATALATYGPLIREGIANAGALGIAGALTGPTVRGDIQTIRLHLDVIDRLAPDVRDVYLALTARQIAMARSRGELHADTLNGLETIVDSG